MNLNKIIQQHTSGRTNKSPTKTSDEVIAETDLDEVSRQRWLKQPLTKELLSYLATKRDTALTIAMNAARYPTESIRETARIDSNLVTAQTINETINHITEGNAKK